MGKTSLLGYQSEMTMGAFLECESHFAHWKLKYLQTFPQKMNALNEKRKDEPHPGLACQGSGVSDIRLATRNCCIKCSNSSWAKVNIPVKVMESGFFGLSFIRGTCRELTG
jgi:hypothetical protein